MVKYETNMHIKDFFHKYHTYSLSHDHQIPFPFLKKGNNEKLKIPTPLKTANWNH